MIGAVVLSAGFSSRMGEFKPLLKFDNDTAIAVCIKNLQLAGLEYINVVTGYKSDYIKNEIKNSSVNITFNSDYKSGMFSSVKKGVKYLSKDVDAFFLLPVDYTLIRTNTLIKLIKAYNETKGKIIYPSFSGKHGHPPLISVEYIDEILAYEGDDGLKGVLKKYKDNSYDVEVFDEGISIDMDNKEDYKNMLNRYKNLDIPSENECMEIIKKHNMPLNIIKHSMRVYNTAMIIGNLIIENGQNINLELLGAGAMLHDIARIEKNHEERAYEILKDLGFERVADIVRHHMDIQVDDYDVINEEEILYLADKLSKEDRVVGLGERFDYNVKKYSAEPEILENIMIRKENAQRVVNKIEIIVNIPFDEIVKML